MSIQAVADFYKLIEANDELRIRLVAVDASEFPSNAVKIGAEHGFLFTEEEVREVADEGLTGGDIWLTDEDLETLGPDSPPHPCTPSGTGVMELMALGLNLRKSGRET